MPTLSLSGRLLLALAIIYAISVKGYVESLDTVFSVETAESIVSGHLDVPEQHDGYTTLGTNGKPYSKFGIGLGLYLTPFVAAGHVVAAGTGWSEPEVTGFLVSWAQVPFALLLLVLFARQLRLFGASSDTVTLLTVALGLGTLCWHYGTCDLSEEMQAALLLGAYGCAVRRGRWTALGSGGAFALLVLVKLVHVILLPLFVAYLLVPAAEPRRERLARTALFLAPVAVIGLCIAWLNLIRFGNVFESGYGAEASLFLPWQLWQTVPALLLSPNKGLLLYSPVLILGLLGLREFFRRSPREAALSIAIITAVLLVTASWHSWQGGWAWGPRLLVPVVPLCLLPAAFVLERVGRPRWHPVAVTLVLLSIVAQVPSIIINDQEIYRIKRELLSPEESRAAPSDLSMAWRLAWHKATGSPERYTLEELGVNGDRELDLTSYRSFQGFNLWSYHAARLFRSPWLRLLPLLALLLIGLLAAGDWRVYHHRAVPSTSG